MRLSGPRARSAVVGSAAVALVAGGLVGGAAGPAYAIDGDDCTGINQVDFQSENDVTDFAGDGSPVRSLQVAGAQQRVLELTGKQAGQGITVAVLDSGVRDQPALGRVQRDDPVRGATRTGALVWHQGTLLAGVIAAAPDPASGQPVGIAPGARIYDQRVYDTGSGTDDDLTTPTSESVAAGLEAIAPRVGKKGIRIITVGVRVSESPELRAAVDKVTRKGAIVVAASGARSDAAPDSLAATFRDGEDYAEAAWPAGYSQAGRGREANPRVLSVATTADSGDDQGDLVLSDYLLFSSAIDLASPSAGAVSLGIDERYCSVRDPSTAVAAAQVSGVLALLMTAYPKDRPEQLITRLKATAAGPADDDAGIANTRAGAGVIQPLEALNRPLRPNRDGVLPLSVLPEQEATPAVLPVPDPDELASTRDNALWWGMLGGGALVVLVLLRPVLARRR